MIIDTASFTRPSPKIILKSFGYSLYLIIPRAATASEAHNVAHKNKISLFVSEFSKPSKGYI